MRRKGAEVTQSVLADAEVSRVVSLFVVSPDLKSARQLSQFLRDSRHSIRVEWVNSGRGQFNRLIDRLSQSSALIPSIVMLDFQTLGGAIWQLIARCSTMLPHLTVEWLIVNHHGSCPPFNEALWQNVTVFGARPTLN